MSTIAVAPKKRGHWRKMTWAILVWTGLMAAWVASAIASASTTITGSEEEVRNCIALGFSTRAECENLYGAAANVGAGIAVFLIGLVWLVGFFVLSAIWMMSRPQRTQ